MGDLGGGDRPDGAAEAPVLQGLAWRDEQAQDHRADDDGEDAAVGPEQRETSVAEPRGEQPDHHDETDQPKRSVGGPETDKADAHHQRRDRQRAVEGQEDVGPDPDPGIDRKGQQKCCRQTGLGQDLGDAMGYGDDPAGRRPEHIEENEQPDGGDPAPALFFGAFGPTRCQDRRSHEAVGFLADPLPAWGKGGRGHHEPAGRASRAGALSQRAAPELTTPTLSSARSVPTRMADLTLIPA